MLSSLLSQIISFISELWKRESDLVFVERKLYSVVEIYDTMSALLPLEKVDRCSIFKVENSGGLLDPKVPIYFTTLHEVVGDEIAPLKMKMQRLLLNEVDIRNILKIIQSTGYATKVDGITDNQKIAVASGVKMSLSFLLKASKTAVYFFSINSTTDVDFDMQSRVAIALTVDKLKQLIS